VDAFPDPRSLGTEELKSLIAQLVSREQAVSCTRRVLHAQIDALRGELVDRLRADGDDIIFGPDILGPGLGGVREPRSPRPHRGSDGVALPQPCEPDPQSDGPGQHEPPDY
jgi:hypothetical protein